MLLTEVATLDEVLRTHAKELGSDFAAYRNHAYRVLNLGVALTGGDPDQIHRLAIAAAFHDLGIWTEGTFDYLQPSVRLASAHLSRSGRTDWNSEITQMILQHHKISPFRGGGESLVEPFRRADWVDVSRGVFTFGLPRKLLGEVFSVWPNEGFHRRLAQLSLTRLRTHPWSPLPMLKL